MFKPITATKYLISHTNFTIFYRHPSILFVGKIVLGLKKIKCYDTNKKETERQCVCVNEELCAWLDLMRGITACKMQNVCYEEKYYCAKTAGFC
jgi:hypothetical protein